MRAIDTWEAQHEHFWLVLARGMQESIINILLQAPLDVLGCRSQRENAKSSTIFDVTDTAAEARARRRKRDAETLKLCAL